jgi:superfamily II DNA/RNA helicase
VLIEVARRNQTADLVAQKVHPVGREMKKDLLTHLVKENDWHQVLVFTRMKHGANRLVEHLLKQGISAMAIHGNKSQTARTKALADFKKGDLQVLVATDIAARGIDIDQLPHVVNFEMPNVPEDYVHRIGRTGRAGSPGEAISLVSVDENGFLRDIERLIKHEIPEGSHSRLRAARARAAGADRPRPDGDRRRRRPRRAPAASRRRRIGVEAIRAVPRTAAAASKTAATAARTATAAAVIAAVQAAARCPGLAADAPGGRRQPFAAAAAPPRLRAAERASRPRSPLPKR